MTLEIPPRFNPRNRLAELEFQAQPARRERLRLIRKAMRGLKIPPSQLRRTPFNRPNFGSKA